MRSTKQRVADDRSMQLAREIIAGICRCGCSSAEHIDTGACDCGRCDGFKPAPLVVHFQWDLQKIAKRALMKQDDLPKKGSRRQSYLSALRAIVHHATDPEFTKESAVWVAEQALRKSGARA